jgi:nitrogen fixation NifU-like protein
MSNQLDDMYRDVILDHYKAPRGAQPLPMADITSDGSNPSCGDELTLQVKMDNGVVKDIHIACRGCAISVASGSMLAEIVKGRPLAEVKVIAELVRKMLKGEGDVEIPEEFEDLDALQGVKKFPVRIKCALLAWVTFIEGIRNYENDSADSGSTSGPVTSESGD